jgi:3-methyladenine DNA glycosylase/8-oxoguanine DNA glycosylase
MGATTASTRRVDVGDLDVRATLKPLGVFGIDPTHRWYPSGFAKAVLTPEGPGTTRHRWSGDGRVEVEAWGDGAGWLLAHAPDWLGRHDDIAGFDPSHHPAIDRLWGRHGRFRLARAGLVWQELLFVMLGQRVTTEEAARSWARLCHRYGTPAPGPCDLLLPPTPTAIAELHYSDLHTVNVERRRADAIVLAARRADRLEEAASMDAADALTRLTALPGLGLWTATSTITVSHGDPDTIVLRDYGLPTMVNYAFTGDARHLDPDAGGDERMCELLAPWAGHRHRVVRLLFTAGISPPRRGPRSFNPDIRRL